MNLQGASILSQFSLRRRPLRPLDNYGTVVKGKSLHVLIHCAQINVIIASIFSSNATVKHVKQLKIMVGYS